MTGAELTTIAAVVTAAALLLKEFAGFIAARAGRHKAAVEPTQLIANAAATLVSSVDDIVAPLRSEIAELRAANVEQREANKLLSAEVQSLAPLRDEVVELRAANKLLSVEVAALRATLTAHGIPSPPGAHMPH